MSTEARWQRIIETITATERLVVRSWAHPQDRENTPEYMRKHMARMTMGGFEPDWNVENEIVIASHL